MADVNSNGVIAQEVTIFDKDGVPISADNPLAIGIAENGYISAGNTTEVNLAAGATFEGAFDNMLEYAGGRVLVYSSHASAANGLEVWCSKDGNNGFIEDKYTIKAATPKTFTITNAPFVKIRYTNGGTQTTTLKICTIFMKNLSVASSHRVQDTLSEDDDGQLVVSVMKLRTAQDNYVSGAATNSGNFKVSLEEAESNVVLQTKITDGTDTAEVIAGSNTGVKGLRVFNTPTDPISDVAVNIDFTHHQIHEGETHQYIYPPAPLASGSSVDLRFVIPAGLAATTRTPHMVIEVDATAETWVYLYETPTTTGDGTLQTVVNRNRNAAAVAPASTVFLAPTVTAEGTLLSSWIIGSGSQTGGGSRDSFEWDLKGNAVYLIRVTAKAASDDVCIRLVWYEDLGV